jgi:hypothetical protein
MMKQGFEFFLHAETQSGLKDRIKKEKKMKRQLLFISTLVFIFGTLVFGQSTDENNPIPINDRILSGTERGTGTKVFSLRSKRGTTVRVTVNLTVAGDGSQAFSLDFRGRPGVSGGQTECCVGETYMPYSADPNLRTSFRVLTDERFLMFLNFSAPETALSYRITFEGLNFDEEPVGDDDKIIVPGDSGSRWVDTGITVRRGDRIILSSTGTVDVSSGWGTHDARGTTRFARVGGYPVNSPRRYGLAARIGSQKWAYTGAEMTATQNGRLYLTCNDDSPSDNNGKFVVTVEVIRRR